MDDRKRLAVREAARPFREGARLGCSALFFLAITFAYTGHWLWFALLIPTAFILALIGGSWLMAQGPADATQRRMFRTVLMMAGVGDKSLPRAVTPLIFPFAAYLTLSTHSRPYVKAAKRRDRAWLTRKLESPDAFDRLRAVIVLEELGENDAEPLFAARLRDEDVHVREAAISALAKAATPQSIEALKEILEGEEDDVHWLVALSGLYRLGGCPEFEVSRVVRAANLIKAEGDDMDRDRLGPLLSTLPAAGIADLLREELGRFRAERGKTIKNLAKQDSPEAVELVRSTLQVEDDQQVLQALLALGREPSPRFEAEVRRLTDHSNARVRHFAEIYLKRINASPVGERGSTASHPEP